MVMHTRISLAPVYTNEKNAIFYVRHPTGNDFYHIIDWALLEWNAYDASRDDFIFLIEYLHSFHFLYQFS